MDISAHTRSKDDNLELQLVYFDNGKKNLYSRVILSVPVVLLAVHSSCPSRCPLTILVQKTNLVTMTLLIKDDPFN